MAWIEKKRKAPRPADSSRKRRMDVYNRRQWGRLRLWKLRGEPLCEVCRMEGRVKAGDDVHHLRTFTHARDEAQRDQIAFDPENLLTVCDSCHNRLHHGDLKGAQSLAEIQERINLKKE